MAKRRALIALAHKKIRLKELRDRFDSLFNDWLCMFPPAMLMSILETHSDSAKPERNASTIFGA
jgi:hypothetical protein